MSSKKLPNNAKTIYKDYFEYKCLYDRKQEILVELKKINKRLPELKLKINRKYGEYVKNETRN